MKPTKKYHLWKSMGFAFKGIGKAIKKERNLKIHLFMGSLAIILSLVLKISAVEWLILILIISLVISLEILNSSLEAICDLLKFRLNLTYHETYWIRNFAAGAVMVLALASVVIGIIIFVPRIIG